MSQPRYGKYKSTVDQSCVVRCKSEKVGPGEAKFTHQPVASGSLFFPNREQYCCSAKATSEYFSEILVPTLEFSRGVLI